MELAFLRFLNRPWVIWILTSKMMSWMLGLFIPWLERNDPLPSIGSVKFIFLISYAATSNRLTHMSANTTLLAKKLAEEYPTAEIIGCEFRDNPLGANEWEKKLKLLPSKSLCAGPASSTTDEREFLMRLVKDEIKNSVVVGNGAHIRRASMVWEHYHPKADLCFRSTPAKGDDDLENPMTTQRRWQTWVFANLVGIFFYKLLGVEHFAKKNLSQPTS